MAEVAGLAVGTIPLTALFQNCLGLYEQIESLKFKSSDLDYLITRATFEHCKFSLLQARLESSGITTHALLQTLVHDTLVHHKTSLERLHKILNYHLDLVDGNGIQASKSGNRVSRALKWIASDRLQVERMVTRLKDLNEQLAELIPADRRSTFVFTLLARSLDTTDPSKLRAVADSLRQEHPSFALAAGARALRIENYCNIRTSALVPARCQITDIGAFIWVPSVLERRSGHRPLSVHDVMREERASAYLTEEGGPIAQKAPVLVEWRRGFGHINSLEGQKYRLDQLVLALRHIGSQDKKGAKTSPTSQSSIPQISSRANIVKLTDYPKFGILKCLGWITADRDFSHIGLVFQVPFGSHSVPISLFEMIKHDRKRRANPPTLGTRFRLAQRLVERVAHLIAIGWVHKSMRSHNILMFGDSIADNNVSLPSPTLVSTESKSPTRPQTDQSGSDAATQSYPREIQDVYLSGFCYTRPGDSRQTQNLSTFPDQNPAFALYRPPRSMAITPPEPVDNDLDPVRGDVDFTSLPSPTQDASLDIYGLGIILLEIALWRTIDNIYKEVALQPHNSTKPSHTSSPRTESSNDISSGRSVPTPTSKHSTITLEEFQTSPHLKRIVQTLDSRVGSCYRDAVRQCLNLEGWPVSSSVASAGSEPAREMITLTPMSGQHHQRCHILDSRDCRGCGAEQQQQQQQEEGEQQVRNAEKAKSISHGTQIEFLESLLASLSLCRA